VTPSANTSENRVILITGSRKGIGLHLVEHYVERGLRVVGCSRKPATFAHERYLHVCADVTHEVAVKALFARIRGEHGRLDALVNNAGIASMNHALLTPMSAVEQVMRTNFLGTYLLSREAAKLMRKGGGGRIVNFSTVAVPLALEGEAAYAASKAAVVMLTSVLAKEFAPLNITVNAVGPTPIETDLIRAVPADKIAALVASQAIKRLGEPRDVANVIDFFLRPESDFVTGQTLYLGGV
jgi:3-oxoacyl-[acyl-carrier protein] reductase